MSLLNNTPLSLWTKSSKSKQYLLSTVLKNDPMLKLRTQFSHHEFVMVYEWKLVPSESSKFPLPIQLKTPWNIDAY